MVLRDSCSWLVGRVERQVTEDRRRRKLPTADGGISGASSETKNEFEKRTRHSRTRSTDTTYVQE